MISIHGVVIIFCSPGILVKINACETIVYPLQAIEMSVRNDQNKYFFRMVARHVMGIYS